LLKSVAASALRRRGRHLVGGEPRQRLVAHRQLIERAGDDTAASRTSCSMMRS
jgi:hypothetical protein